MSTDYISNLPNEVLSHILSCLPIKDAVKTCTLSNYWELKWTSIYNVDIDSENFPFETMNETTFVTIAENVLLNVLSVRKCRLICIPHVEDEISRIEKLLSVISRRKVNYLEVDILNMEELHLPRSLLNCASLTELRLCFVEPCTFRVLTNNCFSNLKALSLRAVKFSNYILNTDMLVFTFPVLQSLELMECIWMVQFVEIYAPSLCKVWSETPYEWPDRNQMKYSIKIFGKKVDELTIDGGYTENIRVVGSTVAKARLRCMFYNSPLSLEEWGLHAREIFKELPNVTCLSIFDLRAIGQTERGVPLPRFSRLKSLHLFPPFDAEGFLKLLHAAPNLKFLAIRLDSQYQYDYDSATPLPSCLAHHLEDVKFDYTDGDYMPNNYLVEKFLLKNSSQLKSVFISARRKFLSATKEKLSRFPKASSHLIIVCLPN